MDLYSEARLFPHFLRGGLAVRRYHELVASGASKQTLSWRARRTGLVRAHHQIYLQGPPEPDLVDLARAALAVCPSGTRLGYHTAAALYGFGIVDSPDVHVMIPAGAPLPQRAGIRVHQSVLPLGAPVLVRGVPCVSAARCAIDLARTLPRLDALPVLDAALAVPVVDRPALQRELTLHRGLRGLVQARELVRLADHRPDCRQESQLRLVLHDAGLREFEPQVPVGTGRPRYYLDLADTKRRIGLEYDGSSHLGRERLHADRDRLNWLLGAGWHLCCFTDADLYRRTSHLVDVVRRAVAGQGPPTTRPVDLGHSRTFRDQTM